MQHSIQIGLIRSRDWQVARVKPVTVRFPHPKSRRSNGSAEGVMEHKAPHARVSDLPLLALLATNDLQKLGANPDTDCFYVAKLFEHLSAEIPDTSESGVRRLAPSAIRVYERAVHEATKKQTADL